MTDPIPATPGWVEQKLERILAGLPPEAKPAFDAFAECIARRKAPAAPSDLLGAEFELCHATLRQDLLRAGLDEATIAAIGRDLEALEAELAEDS